MPPLLEQAEDAATIVLPTIVQTTAMQESGKSLVAPGGGAPPSSLSRLDPEVGGTVLTPFGLARVLQVRSRGVVKCQLKSGRALCILGEPAYEVLSQVPTAGMSPAELAQYALRLQTHALKEAKRGRPGRALQLYERVLAVSAQLLQQQRSSVPQAQRGDWVIRTVKCSIEAARVAIQLHLFPAALDFTKDALGVIDALDRKRTAAAAATAATAGTEGGAASPPPSPGRKAPTGKDEDTSVTSSDSGSVASSTSTSSSSAAAAAASDLQDLGCVKLFGECRVKALLLTAQALLEMRSGGRTLAFAALRLLDQAQAVLRKFSTRQYRENRQYKSAMKALVSLQKDLKRLKKQAKLVIKPPKAAAAVEKASPSRFASFFRLRRVMFADESTSGSNEKARSPPSPVLAAATKAVSAVVAAAAPPPSLEPSEWTRRDTLVLGGVVAGGLVAFHCVMRRHRV